MCGIFGAVIIKPTKRDFRRLENLFLQLQSRGEHATGCAWVKNGKVHIEHEGIPAHLFVECVLRLDQMVNEDGNLYMLGHVRYTTSDVLTHQPIGDETLAIVHNGVITYDQPETWKKQFGLTCQGRNDSELIFQARKAGHVPLEYFPDSTIAVCELTADKTVTAYRNWGRPLAWYADSRRGVFASTNDALGLAGFDWNNTWGNTESYREKYMTVGPTRNPKLNACGRTMVHFHYKQFPVRYEDEQDFGDK